MYWKHAPLSCRNFAELSRRGYYNGVKFHRCIQNFIIQGGDPAGSGSKGKSIYGDTFDDEINKELKFSGAGIIAMANYGVNTNGRYDTSLNLNLYSKCKQTLYIFSQFFITLAPCQHLDRCYTIFGRVHSGMRVIKRIGNVETDDNDCPLMDVVIQSAKIKFN